LIESLTRAAKQFIVTRPPFKTTIAGYHWFGDWGRDTMVSLPGLFLQTGQPELSKELFLQYTRYIDGGMLPNRFPDSGAQPEYNTVDAALWFIDAVGLFVNYRPDEVWRRESTEFLRSSLYEPLKEIVRHYGVGTRYGIHSDDNGFLWAGDGGTQLTWMDARVGGVPVTPRHGRPVEIQALWYNALRTMTEFALLLGDSQGAALYTVISAKLKAAFIPAFWNSAGNCLFDVVGDGGVDDSIRPNQLFAISLRYPLLSGDLAREVVATTEAELLTPFGLRSLAATDRNYRGTYQGDVPTRDGAYHQGTVWPWLAGPFFRAKLAVSENPELVLNEIDRWLETFATHLTDAGVGQISEIFDGDFPHEPRGCIAQAWSVAEILNLAKIAAEHPLRAGER
jgi:predicted glycogen debranching enzyme